MSNAILKAEDMKRSKVFDTHCHPPADDEKIFETQVNEAAEAGVDGLVAVGGDLDSSRALQSLAEKYPDVYVTCGVHPHAAEDVCLEKELDYFAGLCSSDKVCAVGEIGLDYYYDNADQKVQRQVFREFIRLAEQFSLPMVIHCRDAYEDCLTILHEELKSDVQFEIHSFTGPEQWLDSILDLGGYIGFNGIVTFKNAENVRRALAKVPDDRLLLETDAPYLAPVPVRGKRNKPAYLSYVLDYVADLRGEAREETERLVSANTYRFFAGLQ